MSSPWIRIIGTAVLAVGIICVGMFSAMPAAPALGGAAPPILVNVALTTESPPSRTAVTDTNGDTPSIDVAMSLPPGVTVDKTAVALTPQPATGSESSCSMADLARSVEYNGKKQQWEYTRRWCKEKTPAMPVSSSVLRSRLANTRILFLGDSIARNNFVMTFARLCNYDNMLSCLVRMPTHEYDLTQNANSSTRGPMGCVPWAPGSNGTHKSKCYLEGSFADVPISKLTTRTIPQSRGPRRTFIKKGLIGPAMHMTFPNNITVIYLGVTRPKQIMSVAAYVKRGLTNYLNCDTIVVSIGPHLGLAEVNLSPHTLAWGIRDLRDALGPATPIVLCEFSHTLKTTAAFDEHVNNLMLQLQRNVEPYDALLVPQRFVTRKNYLLRSTVTWEAYAKVPEGGQCGYYDPQHPALACQLVTSELLIAAVLARLPQ
jgi:hypothetical protein